MPVSRDNDRTGHSLAELAERAGLAAPTRTGEVRIDGVCALMPGRAGAIAYAEGPSQIEHLKQTRASAVIVSPAVAERAATAVLSADQPKLAFARIAACFEPALPAPGIHSSAVVADGAHIAGSAHIGATVVVGADVVIGEDVVISPGAVIGDRVEIGAGTRIASNTSIGRDVVVGAGVTIEANAAIGGRGFGLVHNGEGWEPIPQMGTVRVGDNVEIGAGTTIDRGALDDTVIEAGVKIDDQVHIGHNCVIGAHTVIAGCTGIAGSCTIGRNCMIGGGVGIGDHVRIADGVIITAASQVPKDIDAPGVYSSTFRAMPARGWRKRLALFRQLDRIEARLRGVERQDRNKG